MCGKASVPLSVRLYGRVHVQAGGDVELGEGVCLVGTMVPVEISSHEGSRISIGDRTFVNYGTSITAYQKVSIGRDCLLGHYLRISDRDEHGIENNELSSLVAPVTIEDRVWIGAHVTILPGIHIGCNSAIAAGSIVTRDIPANCVAAGNPARLLRTIEP